MGCAADTDLPDHERDRHRHGGGQQVDREEQQVEQQRQEKRESRRGTAPAALRGDDRAENARHEEVAVAHDRRAEQCAL
jgi:hypothetical protein